MHPPVAPSTGQWCKLTKSTLQLGRVQSLTLALVMVLYVNLSVGQAKNDHI